MNSRTIGLSILDALRRARVPILAVALTYVVGVVVGILMVVEE